MSAHAVEASPLDTGRDEFVVRIVKPIHQTDHGYRIVRCERDDGRAVVVLGMIPDLSIGERMRIAGTWETSQKYGPRFQVESALVEQPTTEEGLVECLSKMIDGKSTVTKAVCALWDGASVVFKLAAPTGRAARRLAEATGREATTIHRLLGYDRATGGFVHGPGNPLPIDALLLDEASMIDVELMRSVLLALSNDCRIVFVGDADQLPPVGPGAPFRDLVASSAVPTTRLETVHRQAAGSRIIAAAREVLVGRTPTSSVSGDRSDGALFVVEEPKAEALRDLVVKLIDGGLASAFEWCLDGAVQVVSPQRKGPVGAVALNDAIQAAVNPRPANECYAMKHGKDRIVQFRIGDRVMQTKNDYNRGIVNGELGVVAEMLEHSESNKQAPVLSVRYVDGTDEKVVAYARADLHHLDLAYCTTVHKVQGAEFPAVVVVCHESHRHMLERSLLYTALTRAKRLCVLVGTKKAVAGAAKLARSDARRTTLQGLMT